MMHTRPLRPSMWFAIAIAFSTTASFAADPPAEADPPATPSVFAFTLSNGYGEGDKMPSDPAVFENLLVNMKKAGFNTIHCVYRDWRLKLCEKHGVMMMIDVLAWHEGAETDIRRNAEQRAAVKAICEKVRGHKAVWGYNLWNEKLPHFGRPDGRDVDDYIKMLREWDATHPVWMGTYRVSYANAPKAKPGVHGYYDYHWQRGFNWHFADLTWYRRYVPSQQGTIGRWMLGSDYARNAYTLNTSIAFGLKTVIWFIGGPFDDKGDIDDKHRFAHLVKLGQQTHKLYEELGKLGNPTHVLSTPTTKWHDNKPRDADVPWRLDPFPADHWLQIKSGEALAGFFKYKDGPAPGSDAVYIANHNAYADQTITFTVQGGGSVELFDRKTGEWTARQPQDGVYAFPLAAAGGELLRITGRAVANTAGEGDPVIRVGDKPVAVYRATPTTPPDGVPAYYARSGCLHPVYSPSGRIVTGDSPADHRHHHGIMSSYIRTRYDGRTPNFWDMGKDNSRVEHEWVKRESDALVTQIRYHDFTVPGLDANPQLALAENWIIEPRPNVSNDMLVFDLMIIQRAAVDRPFVVEKFRIGGLLVRGSNEWTEKRFDTHTSTGKTRENSNHTRAKWTALSGVVDGMRCGIAVMGHPKNFRHPQPVRTVPTQPYAVMSPMVDGEFTIESDNPYSAQYRIVTFDGPPNREKLDAIAKDFATTPFRAPRKTQ